MTTYAHNFMIVFMIINSVIICLCILLSVAFYTLLERKILGLLQLRKGPNKVSFWGIVQPLSDALKLLIKEGIIPYKANKLLYISVPFCGLILSLLMWLLMPSANMIKSVMHGILLFLCLSSLNVFITLLSGWSSNSKYAFLGALRAAAQSISYEISMVLILLVPVMSLMTLSWYQALLEPFPNLLIYMMIFFMWFSTSLAETNRAPFDFAEGESELVSGFNIEYGGGLFVLLFLSEYSNILLLSLMSAVWFLMFLSSNFLMIFMSLIVAIIFLVVRGVYPRHRYDLLMMLCWKSFLPVAITHLMGLLGLISVL
uniref:NADH dehydrogenase subunit 1 n=1 Tax=Rabdotus mooreanus TaxID=3014811 RepID=UPI00286BE4B0|nr:NADH dehydrogenase subunit 1 [Rabdotus mooreanus]WLN31334.1 NADH dehydrogenase subunit 1 [Rabdotus mooreanus]